MSLQSKMARWLTYLQVAVIDLKDWHEYTTERWIDRLNLSQYASLWISFFKGVATVLLLQWIF